MRLERRVPVWLPPIMFAAAALLIFALAGPASAVPAFSRQTNMGCNDCHTTHGGPVPNFTMTGKKFRSTGYRMVDVRERVVSGHPGDMGERLDIPLLDYWSIRLESQFLGVTRNPFTGDWGEAMTNPTTRVAFFFVGPFGDHFGVWNEWYFHTLGSATDAWSLDLASWDEFDLRYMINPGNPTTQIGLGISNQPIYDLLGFGPFPVFAGGGYVQRGEINGLAHPNYATVFVNGWINDRWSWLLGGNTGDTNTGWEKSNFLGEAAYAFLNTNAHELWLHGVTRVGTDVMPLVTQNYVPDGARDWAYHDGVSGVTLTRPAGAGPYRGDDVDHAATVEGEVIWERQDWGHHSFEGVFRTSWNSEKYNDGAKTKLTTFGVDAVYTWRHTYYAMPFWNTRSNYEFTDRTGRKYDIDTSSQYGVTLGFQPTMNLLLNLQVLKFEVLHLQDPPDDKGVSVSVYVDFLL